MSRGILLAALLLLSACKAPTLKVADACAPYGGKSCISLEVLSATPLSIDQIEVAGTSGFGLRPVNDVFSPATPGPAVALPVVVAVLPGDVFGGAFTIAVRGRRGGAIVGHGAVDGGLNAGDHVTRTVTLEAGLGADADAANSTVTLDRASGIAANGIDAAVITVRLVDAEGAPLAGRAVTLSAAPDGPALTPSGLTNIEGKTTASITSTAKGTYTITATVESNAGQLTLADSPTIKFVTPGVLEFHTQPTGVLVDQLLTVRVAIVDPTDHTVVTDATTPITVALRNATGPASLSGDVTAVPVDGVATFSNLNIDLPSNGVSLEATATSLSPTTSASFDVGSRPWARLTTGIDGASVTNGVFDPTDGMRAYVATNSGIYRSSDGGVSWRSASYGLENSEMYAVAVDPSTPSTLYASNYDGGLFRSTNSGSSWTRLTPAGNWIRRIYVDPKHAATLLVDFADDTIGRSTDGGMTWSTALSPAYYLTAGADGAYSTSNNNLMKTTDGGASWATLGPLPAGLIAGDPTKSKTLYAAGTTAVMKTTDDGANWVPLSAGLPTTGSTHRIAVSPSDSRWIYVVYNDGSVYVSSNAGQSWSPTMFDKATGGDYLAVASNDPKRLLLIGGMGLFATSDGGSTWGRSSTGIAVDASIVVGGSTPMVATRAGVYSFLNDTWYLMQGLPLAARVNGLSANQVGSPWAATADGPYRWDSTGSRWVKTSQTATGVPQESVYCAAVDPNNADHVLIGGNSGAIWRTTDGGATAWTKATLCAGSVVSIDIVSAVGAYAICRANTAAMSGVFESGDGGMTWNNISAVTGGIPATVTPTAFVPAAGSNTIYAAGDDGVVYIRLGGQTTWSPSPGLLPPTSLSSLTVDQSQTRHLFATAGPGVVELTSSGTTWDDISNGLRFGAYPVSIDGSHPATLYAGSRGGVYRTTTAGR